ncbi:Hsp70 family protein [Nocardia higoensis]|uniref:Hsp70 family protein n=1 Tax=Nocardia higoensis TaxID=228599 RepID=A0ABS0DDM9_9NOCA|nr:Hsp70 family protein [Nocardia higoensis]MBF6356225.1 Hsp70 family protein [Nocardia higoensis]
MRTSLGISAGNEVVCSALVATAANGAKSFDYRVVSADAAHSDIGDLVASSIDLMTTQLPVTPPGHDAAWPTRSTGVRRAGEHDTATPAPAQPPTSVAVAYRSKEQAQVIRSAIGRRRELELVPEAKAALIYLRHTGLTDRYDTIALVDLGATGMSVTVAEQADDTVLHSQRTHAISGTAIDELIYHHLVDLHFARRGTRPNRAMLINRGRAAKEHLSVAPAVTIDHVAGRPLKLTRADFEVLIGGLLADTAAYVAAAFARSARAPEAVALVGGGANIPSLAHTLGRKLELPVITVDDPEAVIAKGAALVADAAQPTAAPVGQIGTESSASTFTKVAGVLACAVVVVGLIIGYGIKTLVPTADNEVSPAGTTSSARLPATPTTTATPTLAEPNATRPPTGATAVGPAPGVVPESPTTPQTTTPDAITPDPTGSLVPSTPPTLRPDPNLPPIPFPELLGDLLDQQAPEQGPASQEPERQGPTTPPTITSPAPSTPPQSPARTRFPFPPAESGSAADSSTGEQRIA